MKAFFPFSLFLFFYCSAFAQTTEWVKKTNYAGTARNRARAFSIPSLGKGYVIGGWDGMGALYQHDTYEYDTLTGAWTIKAAFPGASTVQVAFSINGMGYAGTGVTYSSFDSTFWEFDPTANTWTKRAHFPGAPRAYAAGFSINGKGYLGGGDNGIGYNGLNDFYVFDPVTDTWDTMASCPALGVTCGAVSFSIAGKGYVGTGSFVSTNGNQFIMEQDFWEYDPATNKWTQKKDFPGGPRGEGAGFGTCNKGYMGTGYSMPNSNFKSDFWQYDPVNDKWTEVTSYGAGAQAYDAAFSIGNSGYMGLGRDSANSMNVNNWWRFTESVTPSFTTGGSSSPNICAGQSVSFTDTSGYSPTNWQWTFPGGNPHTSSSENPVVEYDTSGIYDVTLSAWNGCDSGTQTFTQYVTVATGGMLTVTANPASICSGQSSALMVVSGSGTYKWLPTAGLTDTTSVSIMATPTVTTTYVVTAPGGNCAATGQVVLTVGNNTIGGAITAMRDTICQGTSGSLALSGNSSNIIEWQSSLANAGSYLTISSAPVDTDKYKTTPLSSSTWFRAMVGSGSCSAVSDSFELIVPPPLTASYISTTNGRTVIFNSSASQGEIHSYYWDFGDGQTDNVANPIHTYAKDSIYNTCLTIYDGSNCSYTYCRNVALGVETVLAMDNWSIYPDPVTSELNIESKGSNSGVQSIEMFDVLGRLVLNNAVSNGNNSTYRLDVTSLAKGVYFVMIRTADTNFVQNVVKQ